MVVSKPVQRHWALLFVPAIAILIVVIFLVSISSTGEIDIVGSQPELLLADPAAAAVQPTVAPPAQSVSQRAVSPEMQSPPVKDATTPALAPVEPVALVNGVAIYPIDLQNALAVDGVMAALAGQAPTDPALLLEQLVNMEVVLQASANSLPEVDVTARLSAFLQTYGVEPAGLDRALAAASIERSRFDAYIARMAATDVVVQAHQTDSAQSPADYVRQLQRQAQISFGTQGGEVLMAAPATAPAAPLPEAEDAVPPVADANPASIEAAPFAAATDGELRGTEVGQLAPTFMLPLLAASQGDLSLDSLRGQPVVLSFWTTWCPYCLRQTPVLVEAYSRWSSDGIQFVGVNVQEESGAVEPYVKEHGIEHPVLLDASGDVARQYSIQGYPTTYFLDRESRIMAHHVGAMTEEQLAGYLQTLLSPSEGS